MDQVEDIRLILRTNKATNLHLPEILSHTKVHLTKFSGCAIEAFQFGIPTIILDKKGANIFDQYINLINILNRVPLGYKVIYIWHCQ